MKEYTIKVTKFKDGRVDILFDDDAPFLGVDINWDGDIVIIPKDDAVQPIYYKLVGDVEYVKKNFNRNRL